MEKDKSIVVTCLDSPLIADYLNEMAHICRAEADRWYHDPTTGELLKLNHGERFALMHSELSEAFEAVRKDKMDDHLPNRPGVTAELADALIRILDYCGDHDLDIGGTFVEKMRYNRKRQDHTNEARLGPNGKRC
jgi:NTP pyrophosphatase (non-canonical NTP hydrolase)